jgi:hypothetical protein
MTWKIFHIYMVESHKMDEKFGWKLNIKNFLDDKYKLTNNLDETNSKTIMTHENHIYMDESYMKDEILGWMWSMNELLDDNWK